VLLVIGPTVAGWLGWRTGRWVGQDIGVGCVLATILWFASALLRAMPQDGP
jgi:hypothetical protein